MLGAESTGRLLIVSEVGVSEPLEITHEVDGQKKKRKNETRKKQKMNSFISFAFRTLSVATA